jgi:predicted nucleotidyltransferase
MDVPDVVEMLDALVPGIREALADNLVGVYLRGSLATGDFDPVGSDIDFFAVTERPVSEAEFAALAALHARLAKLPNRYAPHLEGPYIYRAAARRFRPGERHPTIARGEVLKWTEHRDNWVLERWTVREQGITLLGPDPKTLIDPISPAEIRAAVRTRLADWAAWADDFDDPEWLGSRGHKAYVVETMCRALYTLEHSELPSKPQAVAWALDTLLEPWRSTVERSQAWHNDSTPDSGIAPEVRRFVLWAASQGISAR